MKDNWVAAAKAIEHRRVTLVRPLSKAELYRVSGVSESTFRNMAAGVPLTRPDKIAGIERALWWEPGSLLAVVSGNAPLEISQPAGSGARWTDARLDALAAEVAELRAELEAYAEAGAGTAEALASRAGSRQPQRADQ